MATTHSLIGKSVNWPNRLNSKANRHEYFTDNLPGPSNVRELDCAAADDEELDEPTSISAVMASESSSRSRKGSQLLGLFKENSKAIEERGKERLRREEKEREREKEKARLAKRRTKEKDEKSKETAANGNGYVPASPLQSDSTGENKENSLCSDSIPVSRTKDDRSAPSSRDVTSVEDVPGDSSPLSSRSVVPTTVSRESSSPHPVLDTDIPNPVAARLGSPVRTPCAGQADSGFREGDERSHSPGLQTESTASSYSSTVVESTEKTAAGSVSDRERDDTSDATLTDHSSPDNTGSGHSEDDEDGEDEISSAVYFPHTTPSITRTASTTTIQGRTLDADPFQIPRHPDGPEVAESRNRLYAHNSNTSKVDLSILNGDDEVLYHGERSIVPVASEDDNHNYTSGSSTVSVYSDASEYEESSTDDIERACVVEDSDVEVTPIARKTLPYQVPQTKDRINKAEPPPLGAVELKPYKHQVGGHTALFRFSKKAVCKSLSNRENEFYEAIETRHPDLLKFLPRYVNN